MSKELDNGAKTLAMKVDNTGFMLDRLGQDCHPLQFLRELTKNSIEAIEATPEQVGLILWDVDWEYFDLTEGEEVKLCIIDTGCGMTGDEQVKYINQLSASSHEQTHDGNFGVGAKIAAATRNHLGLLYLSWKDGVGTHTHLWRDPDTGEYGLKAHEVADGVFASVARIEDTVKPKQIGAHGTKVVLFGNEPGQNTMEPPRTPVRTPTKWIRRYLNTRFFDIPSGVEIRVREGWDQPRSNTDLNVTRRVIGQKEYLEKHSEASGTIDLTNGKAHWWLLKDDNAINGNSGESASAGHVAALYKGELYELREVQAGYAWLQRFGLYVGYNRVVIYIEPTVSSGSTLTPNTARTELLLDNEPLPWADWASEFREKLPASLRDLVEGIVASSMTSDHAAAIRERLKRMRDLLRLSKYRRTALGSEMVDPDPSRGGVPKKKGERAEGESPSGGRGGTRGSVYSIFLHPDGVPGEETAADPWPKVKWVSVKDGTRAAPDLEDRAAKYLKEEDRLLINADFRVFQDMVEYWSDQYTDVPGSRKVVEEVVQEWFEQVLVEAVLGVRGLAGSPLWDLSDLGKCWSEEALTTTVLVRYHVNESVKRVLGQRLHSLKERMSVEVGA